MKGVVQSRTGNNGTCFRACLATLLGLKESQVPDFPDANLDPYVNKWLQGRGLRYEEIPADRALPPTGEHLALGISPRGGDHAVVYRNGKLAWDPHPQDGTGRGLVEIKRWGLLMPVAKDSVSLYPDKDGEMQLRYTMKEQP